MADSQVNNDRFRRVCLVMAATVGCLFSAFQILHDVRLPIQLLPGVAARVNGQSIDADTVNRTVAGLDARHRRSEEATRRDVLSRMIDEELLVQHALASRATETSPEVRAALVRSAITRVNAEAAAEPISDQELAAYFAAHAQAYAVSARYELQVLHTAGPPPLSFPGQLVTAQTITNYFGPEIAERVAQLPEGGISEPIAVGGGVVRLYLKRKVAAQAPTLASVHDLVLADAMRARQDRALEDLLMSLRRSGRIEYYAHE